ncbi:MAG: 1,4-alpha-glucan branching protein GlgB [Deltaproteobacteria bacterium]|nr:1,4-alpha-glucan branching protein GlgB [Myxococcales bacterium]MDP3219378.1 1,4-alpha-glucan branching protein GlgB [Deltaproteobacteria bacterium]
MNDRARLWAGITGAEVEHLAGRDHADPHRVLGAHPADGGTVVRALRPRADTVTARLPGDVALPLERIHDAGLWAAWTPGRVAAGSYRVEATLAGVSWSTREPWNFLPTLGPLDEYLFGEGRHWRLHERLGAHPQVLDGVPGVAFAVWAPNARAVSVVGDWNLWDPATHPLRRIGALGLWEVFVPDVPAGARYQFDLVTLTGEALRKSDPYASRAELRPGQSSVVFASHHAWRDDAWITARSARSAQVGPMSIYEMHAGSWRRVVAEEDRWLTWRELAPLLADHVGALGFTHVELMPVGEHPFDASWGYQVTGYFAPTSRHGDPDDFRAFVDHLHGRGIGVIVDWVPAHFPKDTFALARFDGTALYEHLDPRQGEHPDWGTLVFNFGRREVRNFLLASARAWVADFHVDGLRVDAVASMLYLDYSRVDGAWVPNPQGGRENLDAVSLLQELNTLLHGEFPGVAVIAEESTAWPDVTRPVHDGGLGFTFKWNMGWMHDTLAYFARDPLHRRHHHHALTFGLTYAFREHFILALSHDEVVHGKRSLLEKMPGDRWQRLANLRALYAWMWCHPGRKLLFMGAELAAPTEWSEARGLDWSLLDDPMHAGVAALLGDLNQLYRATGALWRLDDSDEGFRWVDPDDADRSVFSFVRRGAVGEATVLCVLNATPVVRESYRLGVPFPGRWREVINSDAAVYGGSGVGNAGGAQAVAAPSHGHAHSLTLRLPPLGALVLLHEPVRAGR